MIITSAKKIHRCSSHAQSKIIQEELDEGGESVVSEHSVSMVTEI